MRTSPAGSTVLFAQAAAQPPADTGADDRAQSFRPVTGAPQMQSGEKLLVEAYAAVWVILFVLLVLSWRRQNQIDRRADLLEAALRKARGSADKGSR